MGEEKLDNILVRQKDKILGLINKEMLAIATVVLGVVHELWISCGYEYKHKELMDRIQKEGNL